MFDIQDSTLCTRSNGIFTSNPDIVAQLRRAETDELQRVLSGSREYRFLERVEGTRNGEVKIEYKALASMGKFTQKEAGAPFLYHNKSPRFQYQKLLDSDKIALKSTIARMENGSETCLRTLNPPKVRETSTKFKNLKLTLSPRAQKVLNRTNFQGGKYVKHDRTNDRFYLKKIQGRIMDMLYAVLHSSMLRNDYARAMKVFERLQRRPHFDMRSMLGLADELLSWKHKQKGSGRFGAPMKLAQWASTECRMVSLNSTAMINNRVVNPNWSKVWLVPSFLASVFHKHQGIKVAIETLELEVNTPPYNQYALNFGVLGALAVEDGNFQLAATSFRRCMQLGGVVPEMYAKVLKSRGHNNLEPTKDYLAYTFAGRGLRELHEIECRAHTCEPSDDDSIIMISEHSDQSPNALDELLDSDENAIMQGDNQDEEMPRLHYKAPEELSVSLVNDNESYRSTVGELQEDIRPELAQARVGSGDCANLVATKALEVELPSSPSRHTHRALN